jgi:hypothetical protein
MDHARYGWHDRCCSCSAPELRVGDGGERPCEMNHEAVERVTLAVAAHSPHPGSTRGALLARR